MTQKPKWTKRELSRLNRLDKEVGDYEEKIDALEDDVKEYEEKVSDVESEIEKLEDKRKVAAEELHAEAKELGIKYPDVWKVLRKYYK